jgi:hypothetical protein
MGVTSVRAILLSMSLLLGVACIGLHPASTSAQDDAARFAELVDARDETASAAGPLAGQLVQNDTSVATADAGIADANFSATATFENPTNPGDVPWDMGYLFHATGQTSQQLFIDSTGTWTYVQYPEGIQGSGPVSNLNTEPGAENTIDLIVDNDVALLGLNGDFVTSVELPPAETGVKVGTGFLTTTTEAGRVIPYRNFEVWLLPGEQMPVATEAPEATTPPAETPASNIFRITVTPETGVTETATPEPSPTPAEATETVNAADAAEFARLLESQTQATTVAGPFTANLKEESGRVAESWAGVDLADFHARADFSVPEAISDTPWDIGFTFGSSPSGPLHIAIDSLGNWYYSIGDQGPSDRGTAQGVVTSAGGSNTIDLLVSGQRALFGVNGTFAGAVDLPGDATSGDVAASVAAFSDQTLVDRITLFQNFVILAFTPSSPAVEETPTGVFTPADLDEFTGYVSDTASVSPALGPFSGRLVESTNGVVPLAPTGTSLTDFGAVASFTNPDNVNTTLWDAGLQYRSNGDQTHRVIMRSNGEVYAVFPDGTTQLVGMATAYDSAPGAVNELQLFVSGNRALVGVNGILAAVVELPDNPVASDVLVGTSFFSEDFDQGRVTGYEGFSIWEIA